MRVRPGALSDATDEDRDVHVRCGGRRFDYLVQLEIHMLLSWRPTPLLR